MGQILAGQHDGVYLLRFEGDVRLTLCATADRYFNQMFNDPQFKSVLVDLSPAQAIDSTSLGLLAKLSIRAQKEFGFVPTLVCTSADLRRLLLAMGFADVFHIVEHIPTAPSELGVLPQVEIPEAQLRAQVLDAHSVLMGMNEHNRAAFSDLVAALEADAMEDNASSLNQPRCASR